MFETADKNVNQKGSRIEGGLETEEFLASSDSVLQKGAFGVKGAQQFYTPPVVSKLAKAVFGNGVAVLDPTAGDGSLLAAFDPPYSYGVEIDEDQIENATGSYHAIKGDIQHVYPLLKLAGPQWDAIAANPPFGLMWNDPQFSPKPINSASLTFKYVNSLLGDTGQYLFIDGANHFNSKIMEMEEAKGVYAILEVEDLFPGTSHPAVIAFGLSLQNISASHMTPARRTVSLEMVDLCADWVRESRLEALGGRNHVSTRTYAHYDIPDQFKAIQKEYSRRVEKRLGTNKRMFDAQLVGGKLIQWMPSAYATIALQKVGDHYTFRGLNNLPVEYFATNERTWFKLLSHAERGLIDIDPKLVEKVESIVGDIRRELVPLYEIKPQQRLGFLADHDQLTCKVSEPTHNFVAGETYRLDTKTQTIVEDVERVVESKKNPGEYDVKKFKIARKVMRITVGHWSFDDSGQKSSENIQMLIDHFDIPDPGEVKTKFPEEIAAAEALVDSIIEETFIPNSRKYEEENNVSMPFTKRRFQVEDIARLGFKKGGLLSWDMGLGKTLGGILFSEYAVAKGAQDARLFITAGDLIPQWQREFKRFLGREATIIKTQAQAHKIAKYLRQGGTGLYLIHYEGLSIAGTTGKRGSQPAGVVTVYEREDIVQVKGTGKWGYYWLEEKADSGQMDYNGEKVTQVPHVLKSYYDREGVPEDVEPKHGYIPERYVKKTVAVTSKEVCPECRSDTRNGWNGLYCEGEDEHGQKCGYVHYSTRVRPIGSFLASAFTKGVIVMDECTKIQGEDSKMSKTIRGMRAQWRLGMTGTPIKNYIRQAFWPMWWSLGNASKRFPYTYESSTQFETDFSVIEWEMNRGNKKSRRALPEVTNLSMFWRLLSSSTIRRRKEETGEDIMPRFDFDISVPLGTAQRALTAKMLKDFPKLFKELYPESPIVKAGMEEIMAPMIGLQQKLDWALTLPESDPHREWWGIEASNWTPAMLKTIELTMALVKQGKKVLVGSNLTATSGFVAAALQEKGVKAIHILDADGKTASKEKRAAHVYSFQTDKADVFCAGVKAIRLGHNLDAAEAVVLHGFDWDMETMTQFVNRVHRLTSKQPISVYAVLPKSTSGETLSAKKWGLLAAKGAGAELALDGRLLDKNQTEIDEQAIVREMMQRGLHATGDEIAEESIEQLWAEMPTLDEYEIPEGLIPDPPYDVTPEGIEAAVAVGAFLAAGRIEVPTVAQALAELENVSDDTNSFDSGSGDIEDTVPVELVLAQNAAELEEQAPEAEEAEAIAEEADPVWWVSTPDELEIEDEGAEPTAAHVVEAISETIAAADAQVEEETAEASAEVPNEVAAMLAQMQEQMEAMKQQLAEETAKRQALEDRLNSDEQLTLFEVAA
jgi:hypothetical protein